MNKHNEFVLKLCFEPKIPGLYSGIIDFVHSEGVISCFIFSEAFYADIRLIQINDKNIEHDTKPVLTDCKIEKLFFNDVEYDKCISQSVTFKNFTNQKLKFEWKEMVSNPFNISESFQENSIEMNSLKKMKFKAHFTISKFNKTRSKEKSNQMK